jgi:hypothetical protein
VSAKQRSLQRDRSDAPGDQLFGIDHPRHMNRQFEQRDECKYNAPCAVE